MLFYNNKINMEGALLSQNFVKKPIIFKVKKIGLQILSYFSRGKIFATKINDFASAEVRQNDFGDFI